MIQINGLVLSNEDNLVGYIVNEDGCEHIWSQDVVIQKSKNHKILNMEGIRIEIIDGKEFVFIDLDEQVTENVLYEVDKGKEIYSKKKNKSNINSKNVFEFINEDSVLEKKIYRLKAELDDENYDTLYLANYEKDYKKYFDSSVKIENLQSIWRDVHVYSSNKGIISDCTHLWGSSGCVVLSEKALDAVKHLLQGNVEILPLICQNGKYYLVNIINYIDAVDYDRAIVHTLMGKYRVGFDKVAIESELIADSHIFKVYIDDIRYGTEIFVTGKFRHLALSKGLEGFKFEEIE